MVFQRSDSKRRLFMTLTTTIRYRPEVIVGYLGPAVLAVTTKHAAPTTLNESSSADDP